VVRFVGDPHASNKTTKEELLRDLHHIDREIFEQLLRGTGQESLLGFAEATITLKNGQSFYQFPPGFRQWIRMERRINDLVYDILATKNVYGHKYAVDILTSARGFRIHPAPLISDSSSSGDTMDWTLLYLRAPGQIHYAQATGVQPKSLTTGDPPENGGELVLTEDYYNGMELRVFKSGNKADHQTRLIRSFHILPDGRGSFTLHNEWCPLPTGEVWYEILPTLPEEYDHIYALDEAITILEMREKLTKAIGLKDRRKKAWNAAKQFVECNTMDRGPSRVRPLKLEDYMVTGEVPYSHF